MKIKQYVIDAFTDKVFGGNPAAVCILDNFLEDEILLNIAKENNLSETAYIVEDNGTFLLRWFTPGGEIDLCGHATLASAFVMMNYEKTALDEITFSTKSGMLNVKKSNDLFSMTFPSFELKSYPVKKDFKKILGAVPSEVYIGRDILCIFDDEEFVKNTKPDFELMKNLDGLLLHISAQGKDFDCVSRSFAPKISINEDPVCGSGHCHIVPFWSKKLNKNKITAFQASERSGILHCEMDKDKVILSGKAVLFSCGDIYL